MLKIIMQLESESVLASFVVVVVFLFSSHCAMVGGECKLLRLSRAPTRVTIANDA